MQNILLRRSFLVLSFLSLTLVGCRSDEEQKQEETKVEEEVDEVAEADASTIYYDQTERLKPEEESVEGYKAICVIQPKTGSQVIGAVTFSEVEGGVRIIADIGGLTPGKHGFHIHEHGDCSAHDGSTAGGHFNPTGKKHGGPDSAERHMGDLGNLEANEYGFAHYDRVDKGLSLEGQYSIIGKSIVIHEGEDDLKSDPTGNSGARIGCGEIVKSEM